MAMSKNELNSDLENSPVAISWNPFSASHRVAGAKIAIIDDEPINIKVVRKHLQAAGYDHFVTTTDSTKATEFLTREEPDVVLLDVMMPQVDGISILKWVRADPRLQLTPVLVLTASTDSETKLRALNAGATDFLAKPVDPNDIVPRIRNALIVKAHQDHLATYSEQLEVQVRARTAELEVSRLQVIHCLARAGEYRDDTTGRHVLRVGRYVSILGSELGMSETEAANLALAAQLHDVGKIGLPDAILLKPGKLTAEEYAVVKRHCDIGYRIVRPLSPEDHDALQKFQSADAAPSCDHPLLALAATIAHTHHERWDGAGYPNQLAAEAIPLPGRITAVADVFDALSSRRPYKEAFPPEQCFKILEEGRGSQFDPGVLDALSRRRGDFVKVLREHADPIPSNPAKGKTGLAA